jgi:hypothetical protein
VTLLEQAAIAPGVYRVRLGLGTEVRFAKVTLVR